MEFEEIQQAWDSQDAQAAYRIDEKALHDRILSRTRRAGHFAHFTELVAVIVYSGSGLFIFGINFFGRPHFVSLYALSIWMLGSGFVSLLSRLRRIRDSRRFERSVYGDLEHGISMSAYQVRISRLMRWNIVPIGMLILLVFWEGGKPLWIGICTTLFFVLAYFVSGIEHRIYKDRRREFDMLRQKLDAY